MLTPRAPVCLSAVDVFFHLSLLYSYQRRTVFLDDFFITPPFRGLNTRLIRMRTPGGNLYHRKRGSRFAVSRCGATTRSFALGTQSYLCIDVHAHAYEIHCSYHSNRERRYLSITHFAIAVHAVRSFLLLVKRIPTDFKNAKTDFYS